MGRYSGKRCRLMSMFVLTGSFFLVEITVGYLTNSMALVADSFHMLSDIAALIVAFISVRMAPKSWDKNTYGWARAEVLGALVNAVFLIALCFSITVESFKRFFKPEEIHEPRLILIVGVMGLIVNLIGLCLFRDHGHSHGGGGTHSHLADLAESHESNDNIDNDTVIEKQVKHSHSASGEMNMRGVFLHILADALGSVIVIISACILWLTDWSYKTYVDPSLSLLLVIIMMHSVWPLLIESALILLQTVPTHIDVDSLKKKFLDNIDGVLAMHEFHVWQLAGDRIIASAHIRCLNLSEYMRVAEKVKEFFHNEGIHSTTFQPEFVDSSSIQYDESILRNDSCVLSCPTVPKLNAVEAALCRASKCCRPSFSYENTPILSRRPSSVHGPSKSDVPRVKPTDESSLAVYNRRSAPDISVESSNVYSSQELRVVPSAVEGDVPLTSVIIPNNECSISPGSSACLLNKNV